MTSSSQPIVDRISTETAHRY